MGNIKAGVIGAGFIGPAHIEALKRINVEVAAVAANTLDEANVVAQKYSVPKAYAGWEELINDKDVNVVHNCTPNNLHFEINKAAIQAGKHIVSEKPLTITSKESLELVKLAKEKEIVNAINFNYRFYPLIQQAKVMNDKGGLGNIYLVHGHYLQDWLYYDSDYNWRLESKISGMSRAVADIGSHWCDIVQFITGSKITKVCADLVTVHTKRKRPLKAVASFKGKEEKTTSDFEEMPIDTEDAGSILIQFENGAKGVFTVSQISAGRKNRFWFEIDGSKKALSWDQENPNNLWIGYRDHANEILIKDPSLLAESIRKFAHYPGGHPEGYPDCLKNLFMSVYDFIHSGKNPINMKPDFPTFEDGHRENMIIEAILKSNKEKNWIEIKY